MDVSGLEIGLVTTEAGAMTGRGSDVVRGQNGRSPSATTTPSSFSMFIGNPNFPTVLQLAPGLGTLRGLEEKIFLFSYS